MSVKVKLDLIYPNSHFAKHDAETKQPDWQGKNCRVWEREQHDFFIIFLEEPIALILLIGRDDVLIRLLSVVKLSPTSV